MRTGIARQEALEADELGMDGRADQDREAIGVIVLNVPRFPALDVPPDGLALTGRPRLGASADDIELAIPLAGGDWTVSAAAGTWYAD